MSEKQEPAEAAFLQDICAHPSDDAPRLVYADWLDDHDQPRRAELIRLQCRLASMDEYDPQRVELVEREWELLAVYRERWLPPWPEWALKTQNLPEFRRGFLAQAHLPVQGARGGLLEGAEQLFGSAPLEDVRLHTLEGRLGDLAQLPQLANLTALDMNGLKLTAADLEVLLSSPYLTHLTRLNLGFNRLGADGVRVLAGWKGLRQITWLNLSHNEFDAGAVQCLLDSPHLGRLTWLNLGRSALGEEGLSLVATSPRLSGLTYLGIGNCGINGSAVRALERERLAALTHLNLCWNELGVKGARALARCPSLERLVSLNLSTCGLNAEAIAALGQAPLGGLRHLDVGQCWGMGDEGIAAIAALPVGNLRKLELINNKMGAKGARALAQSPHLRGLTNLGMGGCEVGPDGAAELAASPNLDNLVFWELGATTLGPEGVAALAASPHLARLRELHLWNSRLKNKGVRAIANSPHLANLHTLDLSSNGLTGPACRFLAKSPYLRQLRRLGLHMNTRLTDEDMKTLAASPCLPRLLVFARPRDERQEVSPLLKEHGKGLEV
jgi:uncharacterized protein (TIGR02996 family)